MYGKGISREGSLLDVAVDLGIIKKSGAWFTYEGEQLGQGRENAKQFLAENVDLMFEIMEKIKAAAGLDETVVDLTAAESPTEPAADAAPEPKIDPEPKPAPKANGKSSAKAKADLELNAEL